MFLWKLQFNLHNYLCYNLQIVKSMYIRKVEILKWTNHLRGCWKIDLIMLNVKLMLRGRGGGFSWVWTWRSHGFGIDIKKKMRKTNEMVRKSNDWCFKNKKCKSSCYQNIFTITIIFNSWLVQVEDWGDAWYTKWGAILHCFLVTVNCWVLCDVTQGALSLGISNVTRRLWLQFILVCASTDGMYVTEGSCQFTNHSILYFKKRKI